MMVAIVLQFCSGGSLYDRLHRSNLPELVSMCFCRVCIVVTCSVKEIEMKLSILRDIVAAMSYLHEHKVIHRDLKSPNVLLHEGREMLLKFCYSFYFVKGRALVSDFGISREEGIATGTLTAVGTPHWMAH